MGLTPFTTLVLQMDKYGKLNYRCCSLLVNQLLFFIASSTMADIITTNASIENVILFIIDKCVTPISGVICIDHARVIADLITSDPIIKSDPFFIGYTPEQGVAFIENSNPRFMRFVFSVVKIYNHLVFQGKLPSQFFCQC